MGQTCISKSKNMIDEISNLCFNKDEAENNQIILFPNNLSTNKESKEQKNENINYKIYELINDIRINPKKYEKEFMEKENNLKETFEKYANSNQKPNNQLIFLEEESNKISNYLKDKKNNDKSAEEKKDDIYNLLGIINNESAKYIQCMGENNNINFCVWDFFESCEEEDLNDILFKDYEFIIVSDVPIENTNKIVINVIFFNK
jgi:hypothetical protein